MTGADDTIARRARGRFDQLRDDAHRAIDDGSLARLLAAPHPPPAGRCAAVIARLVVQPDPEPALRHVDDLLQPLDGQPAIWRYPTSSLHLSVLALTGREPDERAFGSGRCDRLVAAVEQSTSDTGPYDFGFGALGLTGTQLFVEVTPERAAWSSLRLALAQGASAAGESPIVHLDREPVHLNVARLLDDSVNLGLLREALSCQSAPTTTRVTGLELVITDFTVSPGATRVVTGWNLGSGVAPER